MWQSLDIWYQHYKSKNDMHEEIRSRLNSAKECHHLFCHIKGRT